VPETDHVHASQARMKRLFSIDLRLWLPVLLTVLLAGLLLLVDAIHQRQMAAEHLAGHRASLTRDMQRLATLTARAGPALPEEALLSLYADVPGLSALMIVTASGEILHSVGQANPDDFDPNLAREALAAGRLIVRERPPDRLVACQPLPGADDATPRLLFMLARHPQPDGLLAGMPGNDGVRLLLLFLAVLLILFLLQHLFIRRPLSGSSRPWTSCSSGNSSSPAPSKPLARP